MVVQPVIMALVIGLTAVSAIVTFIITCYMSRKKKMTKDDECRRRSDNPTSVVIDEQVLKQFRSDANVHSYSGTLTTTYNGDKNKSKDDEMFENSENSTVTNDVNVDEGDGNDKYIVGDEETGAANITNVTDKSNVADASDVAENINVTDITDVIDNSNVAGDSDVMDKLKVTNLIDSFNVSDITNVIDNSNVSDVANVTNTADTNVTDITDVIDNSNVADNSDVMDNLKVTNVINSFNVSDITNVTDNSDVSNVANVTNTTDTNVKDISNAADVAAVDNHNS